MCLERSSDAPYGTSDTRHEIRDTRVRVGLRRQFMNHEAKRTIQEEYHACSYTKGK